MKYPTASSTLALSTFREAMIFRSRDFWPVRVMVKIPRHRLDDPSAGVRRYLHEQPMRVLLNTEPRGCEGGGKMAT